MPQSLNPRERFRLADKARTNAWLDWCSHPANHEVLEAALSEYALRLEAGTSVDAAANFYKLMGARGLIHTLLNLAEQAKPAIPPKQTELKPT